MEQPSTPLAVGDAALNLTLPDHTGRLANFAEFWQEQPLIILFLRHFGCPHCREQALRFHLERDALEMFGLSVALVGLGTPEKARAFRQEMDIAFPVLCDPDKQAYASYSLLRANPFREAARLSTLPRYIGAMAQTRAPGISFDQDMIQLGGTFLIDTQGIIRYAHRATRIADNPTLAELLPAIDLCLECGGLACAPAPTAEVA